MKNPRRPPFCILKQCKSVAAHGYTAEEHAAGWSGYCIGENSKPETWTAGQVEHVNDICFCIYTPFKGWIRFVVNEDDLEIISLLLWRFRKKTGRAVRLYGEPAGGLQPEGNT